MPGVHGSTNNSNGDVPGRGVKPSCPWRGSFTHVFGGAFSHGFRVAKDHVFAANTHFFCSILQHKQLGFRKLQYPYFF